MTKEPQPFNAKIFLAVLLFILLLALICASCNKPPQITEKIVEKTVTCYDTATIVSTDTLPCNDFRDTVYGFADTLYTEYHDRVFTVKYKIKHDTTYKYITPIYNYPPARKSKVDNSTNSTTNNGIPWYWLLVVAVVFLLLGRFSKLFIGKNSPI